MTTRRTVLIALAVGALATPVKSIGQHQPKFWRVGFLAASTRLRYYDEFPAAMHELGYSVGKNLAIEWRYANGQYERLPALAMELVNGKVDVIVTAATPAARAAKLATSTIPIVMSLIGDPVASGIVASLARPGGNITGLSLATTDTSEKWLELARIAAPNSRVAILANPNQQTAKWHISNIQAVARKLKTDVFPVFARLPEDIERAFATVVRERAGAVIVLPDAVFNSNRREIAQLALKFRLASIANSRVYAEDGALLSYGQNYGAYTRRAAIYVDKIFKGAKPSDLPIEQPKIFEFVVNRVTAKELGLTLPQELYLRADGVIE